MARPKAFDEEQALQGAVALFRAKGFEATSVQDLVDHLGVSRQSLYDTFGDKQALYHACLERYRVQGNTDLRALFRGPAPLRQLLRGLYEHVADSLLGGGGHPCLMVQAALERAEEDPETRKAVARNHRELAALLLERVRRAQEDGEIGLHHDPAALAAYFQNALSGLNVMARSGAGRKELDAVIRVTLSVLG